MQDRSSPPASPEAPTGASPVPETGELPAFHEDLKAVKKAGAAVALGVTLATLSLSGALLKLIAILGGDTVVIYDKFLLYAPLSSAVILLWFLVPSMLGAWARLAEVTGLVVANVLLALALVLVFLTTLTLANVLHLGIRVDPLAVWNDAGPWSTRVVDFPDDLLDAWEAAYGTGGFWAAIAIGIYVGWAAKRLGRHLAPGVLCARLRRLTVRTRPGSTGPRC